MLGATVRRVKRRLMVPEQVEPPNALGALDSVGPEVVFRARFHRSQLSRDVSVEMSPWDEWGCR